MGVLLALETTGFLTSVALFHDGRRQGERNAAGERSHGRELLPLVRDLLEEAGLGQVDVIAVSAGPGSYTGIRVGMSAARGLALGWGARLQAVPTFEAWAGSARSEPGERIVALRSAGDQAAFVQAFDASSQPAGAAQRLAREDLGAFLGGGPACLVGEWPPTWENFLRTSGTLRLEVAGRASAIGLWALYHEGDAHGMGFLPIYLRPPGTGGRGGTA